MKRTSIGTCASVLAVIVLIIVVVHHQQAATTNYEHDHSNWCNSTTSAPAKNASCIDEGPQREKYLPWWYILIAWPDGIQAWGLLLTLGAITWQAVATAAAAKATKDAANASAIQAKHMVNSERPFLMVYNRGVQIWMKNCGKSPAQLIAFSLFHPICPTFVQETNGWPMPQPPRYGKYYDEAWEQTNIGWVAPGERRQIDTFDPTLKIMRKDVSDKFFMYGAIKYKGLYGDQASPFETRYCYGFTEDPFSHELQVFMAGDYGYNQNT